jgi:hypothetical protein
MTPILVPLCITRTPSSLMPGTRAWKTIPRPSLQYPMPHVHLYLRRSRVLRLLELFLRLFLVNHHLRRARRQTCHALPLHLRLRQKQSRTAQMTMITIPTITQLHLQPLDQGTCSQLCHTRSRGTKTKLDLQSLHHRISLRLRRPTAPLRLLHPQTELLHVSLWTCRDREGEGQWM